MVRKTKIIFLLLHYPLRLVYPQHIERHSNTVSLWLLITVCSSVTKLFHSWGPAAGAMPWCEWLPQNVTLAVLTATVLQWQRQKQVIQTPCILPVLAFPLQLFLSWRQTQTKRKSYSIHQVTRIETSQVHRLHSHDSTRSFPNHELISGDRTHEPASA